MQVTARVTGPEPGEQAQIMEAVILAVRRLWFDAAVVARGRAVGVVEAGGELIMSVAEDGPGADRLIADAAERNAFVVATNFSCPSDLDLRLRLGGFAIVQTHGTYRLDEAAYACTQAAVQATPARQGLLSLLRRRWERLPVDTAEIDESDLPAWNQVCWRSFGARGSEAAALVDKQIAFRNMGTAARWYLARIGGRPVGTAMVYQGEGAAQVLAVGTLPGLRGRGVATALMQRLIADWQRDGHGFLFLDTTPGSNAERLYLKLGFVPCYTRNVYAPTRPIP